jgi:hypothetical protein
MLHILAGGVLGIPVLCGEDGLWTCDAFIEIPWNRGPKLAYDIEDDVCFSRSDLV